MCGRYTLSSTNLKKRYSTTNDISGFDPSYNITPGSFVPVISRNSPNSIKRMYWGLVPNWSKDGKFNLINVRDDTLKLKPYFTEIMLNRRVLIPADGFYEWKKVKAGGKMLKEPHYFYLKDSPVFSFAGIFNKRYDAEGKVLYTCAIITTNANFLVGQVHNRMPVILDKPSEDIWLENTKNPANLLKLLDSYPPAKMASHKVSFSVNNPEKDSPDLILPKA